MGQRQRALAFILRYESQGYQEPKDRAVNTTLSRRCRHCCIGRWPIPWLPLTFPLTSLKDCILQPASSCLHYCLFDFTLLCLVPTAHYAVKKLCVLPLDSTTVLMRSPVVTLRLLNASSFTNI
jgi:hypothetical protein